MSVAKHLVHPWVFLVNSYNFLCRFMVVTTSNSWDLLPFTLPIYPLCLLKSLQFQKEKGEKIKIFPLCSAVNTNKKNSWLLETCCFSDSFWEASIIVFSHLICQNLTVLGFFLWIQLQLLTDTFSCIITFFALFLGWVSFLSSFLNPPCLQTWYVLALSSITCKVFVLLYSLNYFLRAFSFFL